MSDRWHLVKRAGKRGKSSKLTPEAVANEHERRARQPQQDPSTTAFPVRAAPPGRPSRAIPAQSVPSNTALSANSSIISNVCVTVRPPIYSTVSLTQKLHKFIT